VDEFLNKVICFTEVELINRIEERMFCPVDDVWSIIPEPVRIRL
jgi:hypothetical protein